MKIKTIVTSCLVVTLFAFVSADKSLFTTPKNWPKPFYNFKKNQLTDSKILLGRVLFYDPILSRNNTISCANCHSQYNAFTHVDHALSHGIDDRIGTRNSLVLMNLAWQKSFMWDGAINHLDMQALAPISHHDEMDENIKHVTEKLQDSKFYPMLFYKAFNDSNISGENTLKAISQFMLTLISANSKYDKVKRMEETFTNQEENGYKLFKQNCASCHTEPLYTNLAFENNGLPIDSLLNDICIKKITQNEQDFLKFKVPTLRNIEFSNPYMHDGRFKRIYDVINHYTNIQKSKTLAPQLQKQIVLTSNEKVDLIAFMLTLTDKEFLFNPKFGFPKEVLLNSNK
jgi:cytochrome c peroxidase